MGTGGDTGSHRDAGTGGRRRAAGLRHVPGGGAIRAVARALPDPLAEPVAAWSRRSTLVYRLKVRSQARRCDVFLVSYPKTGRTWLRALLGKVLQQRHGFPQKQVLAATLARVSAPGMPRVLATHDDSTQDKLPRHLHADKSPYRDRLVVFLTRDPRDTLVSNYFEQTRRTSRGRAPYEGTLAEFLDEPVGGVDTFVAFHNAWAAQRHVPAGFHLVRYEDLKADTEAALRGVLELVGVEADDRQVRKAVEFASFERLKAKEQAQAFRGKALRPGDPEDPDSYKVRRGVVGGYVDYLTPEQVATLDARLEALDPFFGY